MSEEQFEKKASIKRAENIASRKSSFYTLGNRFIVPLIFLSPVSFVATRIPVILLLVFLVIEVILKFVINKTMTEFLISTFRKIFGSDVKKIKN